MEQSKTVLLNPEESKELLKSIEILEKELSLHGGNLFRHIFNNHPDVQAQFFPYMEIEDDEKLSEHGAKVVQEIIQLAKFAGANNFSAFQNQIKSIAEFHAKKDVGMLQFQLITVCLMEYLGVSTSTAQHGPKFSPESKKSWQKLVDCFFLPTVETDLKKFFKGGC